MKYSEDKSIGVESSNPGFAPEIEGAPATIPGSGSDKPTSQMSGTKVERVSVAPSISVDVDGAPNAGQTISNPTVQTANEEAPGIKAEVPGYETSGYDRKIKLYQDMINMLEPQETEEQRKKRERREKSAKIISAVSDGLTAMSNLYFTSQYAPNMYNHEKSSQLTAQNAAIEKARKEREANRDAHLRFALGIADAENERAKTIREEEAEQERRKLAKEKADREQKAADAERALDPFKQGKAKAEQEYWEHKASTGEAEADYAPEYFKRRNDLLGAKIETEKTRQTANHAKANESNSLAAKHQSDTKKGKGFYVENADGNVRFIDNDNLDREFAALPKENRENAGNSGSGMDSKNKPNSDQKRQAIAEYERTTRGKGKFRNTSKLGL